MPQRVRGDPGRVRQVLTNLIGNALKFTPVGEVIVCTDIAEQSEGDLLLRIAVEDTGVGIAPDGDEPKKSVALIAPLTCFAVIRMPVTSLVFSSRSRFLRSSMIVVAA